MQTHEVQLLSVFNWMPPKNSVSYNVHDIINFFLHPSTKIGIANVAHRNEKAADPCSKVNKKCNTMINIYHH